MAALILCIDDEADIRQLLDTILTLSGYRTLAAASAEDALGGMNGGPDLVILDVNLPDMDGIELCRRLRDLDGRVPILFLTAATGARRIEAMAAGGSAFLEKPFDVDELLALIGELLDKGHERRAGRERRRSPPDGTQAPERRGHDRRRPAWSDDSERPASNPPAEGRHAGRPHRPDGFPMVARARDEPRGRSSRGA